MATYEEVDRDFETSTELNQACGLFSQAIQHVFYRSIIESRQSVCSVALLTLGDGGSMLGGMMAGTSLQPSFSVILSCWNR